MRRLLPAVALITATLSITPALATARPILGIADNKPATFDDARFVALHTTHVRINIPWDVLSDPNTLPTVDAWMDGAKKTHQKALVSFDRSRRKGKASVNPSGPQLVAALKAWRQRWPGQVSEISAWNEPNVNKQPALVAGWWLALRKGCPTCTVLPGELVDKSNAISWARRFALAAKRNPSIWGLHAYVDANTFTTQRTSKFLKAIKAKIWLTETGGVVSRTNGGVRFKGVGVPFQTKVTTYLLNTLVKISPLIQRIYVYSWSSEGDPNFDSGLIGPDGTPRPAINVIRKWLGLKPDPTISAR